MSERAQPNPRLLDRSEPTVSGRSLGFINRKYFEPATWEPLLSTEMGRGQYGKFVASMIERIRLKESSCDEVRRFVRLVATEHNWDFMKVAIPYLPELKEKYPHDSKDFGLALLFMLKPIIGRRDVKEIQNAVTIPETYDNGLNRSEEHLLRRRLLGSDREAVASGSMERLFRSTLELGYPQPALDRSMREARERGTDIERCNDGLPMNLRMPAPSSRAGANDNLSGEPLTGLPVAGVDPPRLTPANNTSTSHGDLSQLDGIIEDGEVSLTLEAFLGQDVGSPIPSPVQPPSPPPAPAPPAPPGIHRGSAEREIFLSHYKKSASEFLNYFQTLEGVPDKSPVVGDAGAPRRSRPIMIPIPRRC